MQTTEYARMAEQESTYWWHKGRLRIIETYLRAAIGGQKGVKILNVGSGTGGTIDMLDTYGLTDNVDVSDDAINFMKKRGYRRITKVSGVKLPFKDKSYDIVGAFDVLEHIGEEHEALKEWRRVLKDGGAVVLTVPAYQWLWSGHDVSLHHKRRYTTRRLKAAAEAADLKPEQLSYAIVFSLPMIVSFRFLNKVLRRGTNAETSYVPVPRWINNLFTWFLYNEAGLHKILPMPFGTSVVAVFRRPKP